MDSGRRTFINSSMLLASGVISTLNPVGAAATAEPAAAPSSKAAKLRALLKAPGLVVAAQCMNAEHAAVAQHVGHTCIYIGGSVMARQHFALDDMGLVQSMEMAEIAGRIGASVDIPLITDIDQAGDSPLNVYRTFRQLAKLDIAGAHMEDSINPKHAAGQADTSLNRAITTEEMLIRIDAAVEGRAKEKSDLVILVRSDFIWNAERTGGDIKRAEEETIKRGIAYAKAGADAFMPWSITPEQAERIAKEVPIPLCAGGDLKAMRKSKLKLYFALNNTQMLLDYFEATMRDLKNHDDFDHSKFNIPRGSFRLQEYSNFNVLSGLGRAWIEMTDRVRKYQL